MKAAKLYCAIIFLAFGFVLKAQKSGTITWHSPSSQDSILYTNEIFAHIHDQKLFQDPGEGRTISIDSALKIAEPRLFKIYGEKLIKKERPYNIVKYHNYWMLWGSMNCDGCAGGVFEIGIDAINGYVIYLIHGQ